ncbi:rhodanese-like domain-containing protein [Aneurinibacillus uraniidurans]|uniref:rhodanese-like domain-containing protein n=1 Tax=Aneurinibacillus uraniidurans TaxID=2966586 RepID=UPI00234BE82E|nr:rhodanese-like domain-containing protein [Aneurinibacillus sp. B1]WCN39270.1 rhodanese-like domain-containing protein [Aneurinibacillus sp. B1]
MSRIVNILSQQVQERQQQGEKLRIIDVREPEEVAQGIIPGAVHIRLSELPNRLSEIDKSAETIFVCRGGNRSSMACEYLLDLGYTNVKNLMGGMIGWDGPIEKR